MLEPTDRLWHIARLAWRTLPYAFGRAGREPTGPVAFELRSPKSYTIIFNPTGAVARVSEDATAFTGRAVGHEVNINAAMGPDDPDDIEWCRRFFQAMQRHSTGGVYVNFLMAEGEERVRSAYGPEKYARLAALKARWDPGNAFRMNQNISPKL